MPTGRRADATTILVASLASLQLISGPRVAGLDVLAAALLFFVLPGIAIMRLLFPLVKREAVLCALLVPALSLCAAILVGVSLGEAGVRLTQTNWAIALGSLVVGCSLAGAARRGRLAVAPVATPRRVRYLTRRSLAIATAFAGTITLAAVALVISARPVGARHIAGYAALALTNDRNDGDFKVFVQSEELQTARFVLSVRTATGASLRLVTLRLAPGQTWSARIVAPEGAGRLTARLIPVDPLPGQTTNVVYANQD
jgi:hypothetical protein